MVELKPRPFCGSLVKARVTQRPEGDATVILCENTKCYMAYPLLSGNIDPQSMANEDFYVWRFAGFISHWMPRPEPPKGEE